MKNRGDRRWTKTVIPAQPGFDVVELFFADEEKTQPKFNYSPVLAWIVLHHHDDDDADDFYYEVKPVCFENEIQLDNCFIRQPDGSILFPGLVQPFAKEDEAGALAHAVMLKNMRDETSKEAAQSVIRKMKS